MKLGKIIKNYRREHNLSQREFAKKCGLSHAYIPFIEKGLNPNGYPLTPSITVMKQLATAMGMSVHELISLSDDDMEIDLSLENNPSPELLAARTRMSKDISEKIKALRVQNGLTLEQVGDHVGVSKSTVLKWESGVIQNMRRDKLVKLAEILGTTPGELLGWTESRARPENDNAFKVTPHERALVEAYRANPAMQPAVNRLLGIPDEMT